jgi:predicted ATPase
MRELVVRHFSSIKSAELAFSPLTLIIGPQASGKSVLCKLAYFFGSCFQDSSRHISEAESIDQYKEHVSDRFLRLFPMGTWGGERFELYFRSGDFEIKVIRSKYADKVNDRFNVKFSASFSDFYEANLQQTKEILTREREELANPLGRYRLQEVVQQDLRNRMGADYIQYQLFVPAGRSFFTSVGKALAAFEYSNNLDELTLEFGRVFSALSERDSFLRNRGKVDTYLQRLSDRLLEGTLVRVKDREFLETKDGRRMPLSTISSGQQELLPLLRVLPRGTSESQRVLYIEELEAHLFPDAQSQLVEGLATLMSLYLGKTDLVLTTHSPYVLTKFNNLIKAGQLGKIDLLRNRVAEVVPFQAWVNENQLAAYAIRDGSLQSILGDDGLIDGDYLDHISTENSEEFSYLLGVEFGN